MEDYISALILFAIFYVFYRVFKKSRENKKLFPESFGLRDPNKKGDIGEKRIAKIIEKYGRGYIVQNAYIPKGNGEYTEIDLIWVTNTGLYVIESKNYKGKIRGDEKYKDWLQIIKQENGRSKQYKFYSPVKQNDGHIAHLQGFLGLSHLSFRSWVVFGHYTESINVTGINRDDVKILGINDVREQVVYEKRMLGVFKDHEVDAIYQKLYESSQRSDEFKQKHIDTIKSKKNSYNKKKKYNKNNKKYNKKK